MDYIVEKYRGFNKKELQSGYRCKTFLLNNENEKYIYQVYIGDTKYQANKKAYITNLIKKNIIIPEIPNIIEFQENAGFAYLVTEYKEGIELDKIDTDKFDYYTFYKSLVNILSKIHSINIGDKFRMDWKMWLRRKRVFL